MCWRIANLESTLKCPANPSGRTRLFPTEPRALQSDACPPVVGKISLGDVCGRQHRCCSSGVSGRWEDTRLEEMDHMRAYWSLGSQAVLCVAPLWAPCSQVTRRGQEDETGQKMHSDRDWLFNELHLYSENMEHRILAQNRNLEAI